MLAHTSTRPNNFDFISHTNSLQERRDRNGSRAIHDNDPRCKWSTALGIELDYSYLLSLMLLIVRFREMGELGLFGSTIPQELLRRRARLCLLRKRAVLRIAAKLTRPRRFRVNRVD